MEFGNSKKYKFLNVGDARALEGAFNSYAQDGRRVVSVVWNNDTNYYSVILEK